MGSHKSPHEAAPDSRHLEAHPKGSEHPGSSLNTSQLGGDTSSSSTGSPGCGYLPAVPAWVRPRAQRARSLSRGCGGTGHPQPTDVQAVSQGTWQPFRRPPSPRGPPPGSHAPPASRLRDTEL